MVRRLAALAGLWLIAAFSSSLAQPARERVDDVRRLFLNPPANARIMMRWWWFGPAVTKLELEREMRAMQAAGIGGFEVQPVYPLALDDSATGIRTLPFLSDDFLDALRFTGAKARELGLRMDVTLGSGWPYGGPGVTIDRAAGRLREERVTVPAGIGRVAVPSIGGGERLIASFLLPASASEGNPTGLTDVRDGVVRLAPDPNRPRQVLFLIASRTGQVVKRAAVGAEGFVLDHYDRGALDAYLAQTGERLLGALQSTPPFAIFCDSLEVYASDWTADFLAQFKNRRGYDLTPHLPSLLDASAADGPALRRDWGRTLTELLNDRFVAPLAQWARAKGTRLRLQGYGTPPATVSTNALADLPEGEGAQWRTLWASRWAASASHIYNRPVTSSETWTWIHSPVFRATPLDLKAEGDLHFLQGINQLVGHGWPYSPPEAGYPGWAFYAAGALNDRNPWWIVMPDLSRYLQRISFLLRQGTPRSDVAIYLPTDDAMAHFSPGHVDLIESLRQRLEPDLIPAVLDAGYSFDVFDDAALEAAGRVDRGALRLGPGRYPIVIVPGVEQMPIATLRTLAEFARAGGILIATRRVPDRAPGFLASAADHAQVRELARHLFRDNGSSAAFVADERAQLGAELRRRLTPSVLLSPASPAIGFVHRRTSDADIYFFANTGNTAQHATVTVRVEGTNAEWWDPMDGRVEAARVETASSGTVSAALDLVPYASRVLVVSNAPSSAPTRGRATEVGSIDLSDGWMVTFAKEAAPKRMDRLRSWTEDESTRYFSGVATYEKAIDIPAQLVRPGNRLRLDFGPGRPLSPQPLRAGTQTWFDAPVRDAAVIFVNGVRVGSIWCPPYSLDLGPAVHEGPNVLRILVGNLAINDMAGRALPSYRLLNLRYGARFEPQDMDKVQPQAAGLLGSIRLIAVHDEDSR
jgi:hypothetical protein